MRVAFNGYFWRRPHTGSGQYLRHLWEALPGVVDSSDLSQVLLLPPSQSAAHGGDVNDVAMGEGSMVMGSAVPLVGGRSENLDKMAWEAWGAWALARRERASLLHVPYLSAPLPLAPRGRRRMPVVVTAHDVIPWVVPGYEGSGAVRLYFAVAAAAVRRADLVLADSDASRRDGIRVLRLPPARVRTVYLGVEAHPTFTGEQMEDVRRRHNLPPAYAFYLGGFDRRKNVPMLIDAWRGVVGSAAAPECPPVLAIGGSVPEPGGVFPDIQQAARTAGFDPERADGPLRFLGRVSEEDKALLMAGARLFVYPSAYEGFGLDPLEAMSVGCPVVSSSGGSLSEVVGEGGILVPPRDGHALQRAAAHVWASESLRAGLSERGRQQAARFTWERTAQRTLAMYRSVLQRQRIT